MTTSQKNEIRKQKIENIRSLENLYINEIDFKKIENLTIKDLTRIQDLLFDIDIFTKSIERVIENPTPNITTRKKGEDLKNAIKFDYLMENFRKKLLNNAYYSAREFESVFPDYVSGKSICDAFKSVSESRVYTEI